MDQSKSINFVVDTNCLFFIKTKKKLKKKKNSFVSLNLQLPNTILYIALSLHFKSTVKVLTGLFKIWWFLHYINCQPSKGQNKKILLNFNDLKFKSRFHEFKINVYFSQCSLCLYTFGEKSIVLQNMYVTEKPNHKSFHQIKFELKFT